MATLLGRFFRSRTAKPTPQPAAPTTRPAPKVLTESEKEKLIVQHQQSWLSSWSSTQPADRSAVESAFTSLYKAFGYGYPPKVVWVRSPAEAIVFADGERRKGGLRRPLWSALKSTHRTTVSYAGWDNHAWDLSRRFTLDAHLSIFDSSNLPPDQFALCAKYRGRVETESLAEVAVALFRRDVFGLRDKFLQLDAYEVILRQIWYWWPFGDEVIACERPSKIAIDPGLQVRLHNLNGPAVEFRDGWGAYAVRGVSVPREWVTARETLSPEIALTHPNIEQRRIAAELIGWARILEQLKTEVVDENPNPQIGTLLRVDLPDAPGALFLRVQCGTGRTFCLPVARGLETALAANAWTYGVPEEYISGLEART